MDFSLAEAALMLSSGIATSMSFFGAITCSIRYPLSMYAKLAPLVAAQ
jgi:hypothetical protein